jgi:hypothetical protein
MGIPSEVFREARDLCPNSAQSLKTGPYETVQNHTHRDAKCLEVQVEVRDEK